MQRHSFGLGTIEPSMHALETALYVPMRAYAREELMDRSGTYAREAGN